jgi:hypothetical protein
MKSNTFGAGLIEEKCGGCVKQIHAQFCPCVALRENVFRQTLGAIAAVVVAWISPLTDVGS